MLTGCAPTKPPAAEPHFPREFRAAWVTTLGNIDWPSKPGLSTAQLRNEILLILERAQDLNLNAIILQVRANGDAIYPSKYAPWARALTGVRGRTPADTDFDPLKFWIDESHRRGIELHAWMNPYRAGYADDPPTEAMHAQGVIRKYGRLFWYDPGDQRTLDYLYNLHLEVAQNYDIDGAGGEYNSCFPTTLPTAARPATTSSTRPATRPGVGPDPAPFRGASDFPDDESYKAYQGKGGKLSRADWRRKNINDFKKRLYEGVKREKKWVQVFQSPYGVARIGRPAFATGPELYDPYDAVYADSELWLRNGWCDIFIPSLYWKTGSKQPYLGLIKWWSDSARNPKGRHIYGGLYTSQVTYKPESWSPDEITGQVAITRDVDGAGGNAHFSMHVLTRNPKGMADQLRQGVYSSPALVPASPWLGEGAPSRPRNLTAQRATPAQIAAANHRTPIPPKQPGVDRMFAPLAHPPDQITGGTLVTWDAPLDDEKQRVWRWAVYSLHGEQWKMQVVGIAPGDKPQVVVPDDKKLGPASTILVAAVDRTGNESARAKTEAPKP